METIDLTDVLGWGYSDVEFLNKVLDYANDNDLSYDADRVDIEVFCNYLDSFLNGKYLNSDVNIMDCSDDNLKSFIDLVQNT